MERVGSDRCAEPSWEIASPRRSARYKPSVTFWTPAALAERAGLTDTGGDSAVRRVRRRSGLTAPHWLNALPARVGTYAEVMPAERTEVTEIVTGLAMLGHTELDRALGQRPAQLLNVAADDWDRLTELRSDNAYAAEFESAWANGRAFLQSERGLRRRPPVRVEWKGYQRAPAYEQIPADLRVDHVYLVSCKYRSKILFNVAPSHLFDHLLIDRPTGRGADWYGEVAPEAYQTFYADVREAIDDDALPPLVADLDRDHRQRMKLALKGSWPETLDEPYREFAAAVSNATARRWRANLRTPAMREEMLWRLLRLQSAPYFVLGAATSKNRPLRIVVVTPWDWRQVHRMIDFEIESPPAGQPRVTWRALVQDLEADRPTVTEGHVEIRWSHGRFAQVPEAKVYLDTDHEAVCGYAPLEGPT